jgi:hypothetical protein
MNDYEIDELVNRMYSIVNNEIKNNIKYKKSIFIKLINKLESEIDNHLVSEILDNLIQEILDNLEPDIDKHLVKDIDNNSLVTYIAESNYNIFLNINKHFVRTFEKRRLRRSEKRRIRKFEKRHLRTRNTVNLFDVDIKFIKQCYNLHNYTNNDIVSYVKNNNYINYIFHPKQLYNLFNDKIKLLVNKNNCIQVEYENNYYDLHNFVNYIETFSYNTLKNICIKEIENNNFTENKLLILIYIGSGTTINAIIQNLKKYSNIEKFSLSFCINYKLIDKIVPLIKTHFTNYIIYSSNEFGNDITPSLLIYDDIINKYNFDYILKIHTKSDITFLYKAMNYLFNANLQDLLLRQNENSSSIGFTYVKNTQDDYNKILNTKYSYLLKNNEFVPGTIFLTNRCVMDKVLQFLIDNYKIIFYQNMYDDNTLNKDCSYVHFMERLFGYI